MVALQEPHLRPAVKREADQLTSYPLDRTYTFFIASPALPQFIIQNTVEAMLLDSEQGFLRA